MAYSERTTHKEYGEAYHLHGDPVCDSCADAGAVPFETRTYTRFNGEQYTERTQVRPWCWFPHWGAPCQKCGKPC